MSASAPSTDACPDCRGELPRSARYCPACGSDLGAGRVPVQESPIAYEHAEARWLGLPLPHVLLGLAGLAAVLAIVLFAAGRWPYGLILLGIAALGGAAFLEAARRRGLVPARGSAHARDRAQTAVEIWRARASAGAEVRRVRNALALLDADRRSLHEALGAAVVRGDEPAEREVRRRLADLDAGEGELRIRLDRAVSEAGERIREARLPVEKTMMVLPAEPTPPPGEADPPQPAVVPEPYPPPDEGDPPQPARVPEPSPGGPGPKPDDAA